MWGVSGNRFGSLVFDEAAFAVRPRPAPVGPASVSIAPPLAPFAAGPVGPTLQQEVAFISGVNADGTIAGASYWSSYEQITAFKFGAPTAGTGATISYAFDAASAFTATEQATFREALAMWQSVADVHFVAAGPANANILLQRGDDESAFTSSPVSEGAGRTLGQYIGQALISLDTNTPGFDLSGSFDTVGGYGIATAIHEIGHALGLGHAGAYNGDVDPATQQFSAYDDRLYSTMSYLSWVDAPVAKYRDGYPVTGTNWGNSDDGYRRDAPHSVQLLDILAIQRLYGAARDTPLSGGQVYGFNSNIVGSLHDFFDFTTNTQPVVTLYNQGTGNTLDVSGWAFRQTIDLNAGAFSSVGGLVNNIGIAFETAIDSVRGGAGKDVIAGNDNGDTLSGGAGNDQISGGMGNDLLDGGGDADILTGGAGDDSYVVDSISDRVAELAAGGYDLVTTTLRAYTLGADVEALTFAGSLGGVGSGNALDNRLTGGGGDDRLDGGGGADTLAGGAGDDIYVIGDIGDRAIEAGDAGDDLVMTTLDRFTLGAAIEALTFTGAADATGTGNRLDNRLTGGAGDDMLSGLFGTDMLTGGDGDDRLDGGGGADLLAGGAGNDNYLVDDKGDTVSEARGQGTDTVVAEVDYTLGADLENLTLAGSAHQGTGNAAGNIITGGGDADVLSGLKGGDTLAGGGGNDRIDGGVGGDTIVGGAGRDTLTGGGGADVFAFATGDSGNSVKAADTIADFSHARHDIIDLSAIDAIAGGGTDDAFAFIGAAAFTGHAGELRYGLRGADTLLMGDIDGDGTADLIIRLSGHVALAAADFAL